MKHRRNLAVAAVTAVVVTTAFVGTTMTDLVTDRTADDAPVEATSDQTLLEDSLVRTDLPEVPSAEEISTSRESQGARDQMMVEIVGRIDQAVDRADELELELMRQHSLAQAQLEEAAQLQEEAEQANRTAQAALALDASEQYQQGDTSAADVLLGDENTLSQDATDQQLSDQAEREAADAAQLQREADAAAEEAEEAATAASDALAATGSNDSSTSRNLEELDSVLSDLLETLQEEEGFEGSLADFLTYMYGENQRADGGSGYFDSEGNLDGEAVRERIRQLRANGPQTVVAEPEAETTEDSSDAEEGEAAASEESEVTPAGNFDSLTSDQRELLTTGAELEAFDGSAADYYQIVLDNDGLSSGGSADWTAIANHVAYLESRAQQQPSEQPSASETPSASPSQSAEASPSPSASSTPSPSPTETSSPSPTQTAAADYGSLSSAQKSLLADAADLEPGFDGGAADYYNLVLNNDLFTTSGGSVSWTVLEGHVTYLENQAAASASPSPSPSQSSSSAPSQSASSSPSASPSPSTSPSPTQSSSSAPTQSSSPAPSQTSRPAVAHWDDLSREMRDLLNEGSRLEPGFSGSGGDYWRAAAQNSALTNSDGSISASKLASHVSYLRSQQSSSSGSSSSSSGSSSNSSSSSSGSSSNSSSSSSSSSSSGSSSGGSQPASSSGGGNAAQIAMNWARNEATRPGTSYVLGANGPNSWDCSSFVQAAYRQAGVSLGRTTYQQINQGRQVSWGERQPGDLIFWGDWHVAIYLGNGMIADAGNPRAGVSVRSVFGSPTSVRRVG